MSPSVGPSRLLVLAALVLPLVFTGALVVRYSVDVPVQDDWTLVKEIEKTAAGEWGLDDLVRSQNGHRIAVPRLILVGLALASDWRADLPVYLSIAFAAGILALAWKMFPPSNDALATLAGAAFVGMLVASQSQWENWLWGIQMHVFLAVLLVLAALACLSLGPLRPRTAALGAALALVASLTQGAGLVLWPVGAVVLAARAALAKSRLGWVLAGAWTLGGTAAVLAYLVRQPGDAGLGGPTAWVLRHPVGGLRYLGSILGHPLVAWDGAAFPPHDGGLAAVVAALAVVAGILVVRRARRDGELRNSILPLALILWSVGVGGQVALGRAETGTTNALASRYVTLMLPFWIGLALLLLLAGKRWGRWVLIAMCLLVATSSASAVPRFPERHRLLMPARRALLTGESRVLLQRLHSEVSYVEALVPTLKRLGLSVFRASEPVPIATSLPLVDPRQRLVCHPLPKVLEVGSRRHVRVEIGNGGHEGWSASGDGVATGYVAVASRWFDPRGAVVAEGSRSRLPRDLGAGASIVLDVVVVAPEVPAGSYFVEISAVQEGVAWLPEPARFEVEVRR